MNSDSASFSDYEEDSANPRFNNMYRYTDSERGRYTTHRPTSSYTSDTSSIMANIFNDVPLSRHRNLYVRPLHHVFNSFFDSDEDYNDSDAVIFQESASLSLDNEQAHRDVPIIVVSDDYISDSNTQSREFSRHDNLVLHPRNHDTSITPDSAYFSDQEE